MDEIDDIPEFDSEVTPLEPVKPLKPTLNVDTKTTTTDKTSTSTTVEAEVKGPMVGGGKSIDLVICGTITGDFVDRVIANRELQHAFNRVFVVNNICGMELVNKLKSLSSTGISLHNSTNWACDVLQHLKRIQTDADINKSRQVTQTILLNVGLGMDQCLVKLLKSGLVKADIGKKSVGDVGLNLHSVETDLISDVSLPLSFSEYYHAMCWRPICPSGHVTAIAQRCIIVSTKRVLELPSSFLDRALQIHQTNTKLDRFFDHILPSILTDFTPHIHE